MAEESKEAVGAEDALPMQKTSPTALIAAAVGGVVILGLVVFALTGGDNKSEKAAKVEATEQAADDKAGMTKAELEERQAHLKKTQAALIAAAADDAEEDKEKKAAEQKKQAAAAPASSPASAPSPSPKPAKKPANTKKSMDGLDALGADITNALQ